MLARKSESAGVNWASYLDRGTLISLSSVLILIAQTTNLIFPAKFQQYRYLAESFLAGRVEFLELPGTSWGDSAPYRGSYYWPLAPFPSLLLTPFVWLLRYFGQTLQQGYVNFLLIAWTCCLIYRLARKHGKNNDYACWLTLAFVGFSSYLSMTLIPWSWHLAHVIAVWLMLLAIHEYLGRRRWQLIGLYLGLVFASRQTAGLVTLGFAALLFLNDRYAATKFMDGVRFVLPIGGSNQLGYRFSLDFLPLLVWLILRTDALRFTAPVKTTIALSVLLNLYFLTTVFNG